MSYLRGEFYIWSSDTQTHFWAAAGDDGWAESVWSEHVADETRPDTAGPSGVGLAQHVTDAYVVMRFAELVESHALDRVIDHALKLGGDNAGCDALRRHAPRLRLASESGVPKMFELASTSRMETWEHLAERFFREVVVEYEYRDCFVTDESDLYDFADLTRNADAQVDAMLDRFRDHYLLDPRPQGTTNIASLLQFLGASGVTG